MQNPKHLFWILYGLIAGFASSYIFGDWLNLPVDLYYLIYFTVITAFFAIYIKKTKFDLKKWFSHRLLAGIILGLIFAIIMILNVYSRPATVHFTGGYLIWELFWRGLLYGTIDGLLLTVFPWIVTWRAFNVPERKLGSKILYGVLAWIFILFMTSAYHLGYEDFRSSKVLQANMGNTIMSIPTLLSANPAATPITHAALHIAAILHSPETELFLPPHRTD